MLNEQLRQILSYTVIELRKIIGQDYESAILFGSYARGDFDSESDIDVAVMVNCSRIEAKKYIEPLAELMTDLNLDYDVLVSFCCIPVLEFDDKKDVLPFYRNIENEGVELIA